MKHLFILNPVAGKHQSSLQLQPQIESFFESHPLEYEIHVTTHAGEATEYAKKITAEGEVRVYACGGDGTVLEVVNGIAEAPHAELACVPCGSGNDFLRFLPNPDRFRDLGALIAGRAQRMDLMKCNGRYSLNMCSMGMDANVADRMVKYKRLPLVSGPMAYNLAIVRTFFGRLGQKLRVVMETENGTVEREDSYLFALAANGQYYGGGYHGSPRSKPDDGLLDFILIKNLSHLKVLAFLGKYKKGEHLDLSCCESFRGTRMHVFADKPAVVTADGECFSTTDVTFEILPQAVSFVLPASDGDELLKNYEISGNYQIKT
ncbi:MAG: diacylglycerol kinase family lipid kinase [Clostridia bacterium]|nr:diacylglycerol kinase family lipid kinase [Clostridia bacterium]